MSSLKELIAAERANRAAGVVAKPSAPIAERVVAAAANLEDTIKRSASDYLSARDVLKAQRVAAGYRW